MRYNLNVRAFNSTMNALKCPLCKGGVFVESKGFLSVRDWFSGAFLMLPRDGTMETQGYANGWKAFKSGSSILVLMGFLLVASRSSQSVYY